MTSAAANVINHNGRKLGTFHVLCRWQLNALLATLSGDAKEWLIYEYLERVYTLSIGRKRRYIEI